MGGSTGRYSVGGAKRIVLCLTVLGMGVACSQNGATPPATPARLVQTPAYINPGRLLLSPGGVVRFTPEPVAGTPESQPILTIRISLVDADTWAPVRGDVLVGHVEGEGEVVYRDVSQFALELPGQMAERIVYVTVEAEGYKTWSRGYRYRLEHSRTWEAVVEMEPADGGPAPAPVG